MRNNKITRKKKFGKLQCSPLTKNKFSCYTKKNLIKLKNFWNKTKTNKKIRSKVPKAIWHDLKNFLKDKCNDERCN